MTMHFFGGTSPNCRHGKSWNRDVFWQCNCLRTLCTLPPTHTWSIKISWYTNSYYLHYCLQIMSSNLYEHTQHCPCICSIMPLDMLDLPSANHSHCFPLISFDTINHLFLPLLHNLETCTVVNIFSLNHLISTLFACFTLAFNSCTDDAFFFSLDFISSKSSISFESSCTHSVAAAHNCQHDNHVDTGLSFPALLVATN